MKPLALPLVALTLTGLLPLPSAHAQSGGNWIEFSSSAEAEYAFNLDRTQADSMYGGRVFTTWMRGVSKTPRTLSGKPYHRTVSNYRVWCDTLTIQNLQTVWYDKKGGMVASDARPQLAAQAVPDTIGDQLVQEVCSVMAKK